MWKPMGVFSGCHTDGGECHQRFVRRGNQGYVLCPAMLRAVLRGELSSPNGIVSLGKKCSLVIWCPVGALGLSPGF